MGLGDLVEAQVLQSTGRTFPASISSFARWHSQALAKCEPMIRFWRIQR